VENDGVGYRLRTGRLIPWSCLNPYEIPQFNDHLSQGFSFSFNSVDVVNKTCGGLAVSKYLPFLFCLQNGRKDTYGEGVMDEVLLGGKAAGVVAVVCGS